jgi:hypothetical protein
MYLRVGLRLRTDSVSLSRWHFVESKRERMKKLNCLSIQEKENTRLIYREKTILGEAEYHNRSPKPTTSAVARPPPQHGGRRGPWGLQATGLMPAALAQWGLSALERHRSHQAKSDANTPPLAQGYPNKVNRLNKETIPK